MYDTEGLQFDKENFGLFWVDNPTFVGVLYIRVTHHKTLNQDEIHVMGS